MSVLLTGKVTLIIARSVLCCLSLDITDDLYFKDNHVKGLEQE